MKWHIIVSPRRIISSGRQRNPQTSWRSSENFGKPRRRLALSISRSNASPSLNKPLNPASKFSLISGTAICLLVSASAQQPDRAVIERYYQEAQRALAEKRLDVAVKAYESLTRVDPNTAENYVQPGLV